MSKDASFDVVSDFDKQEMVNAIDQAKRELDSRFDLKDTGSEIELVQDCAELVITSTDETRVKNILDIVESKMIKRGLSGQILEPKTAEDSLGGRVRQKIVLKRGIDKDLAKKIVSAIKETKLKVQPSIQGDQVRVSGKDKDDLQAVISLLREKANAWAVPLQFENYR